MGTDSAIRQKDLGAFYTDDAVVHFLVRWGLAHAPGAVMDPSCGDGRFLLAAASLGATRLIGCDIDPAALAETEYRLRGVDPSVLLLEKDFFTLDPLREPPVELVVGNPPFIRYQRFTSESRRLALQSAQRIGVRLTKLTSTWAPFLLHAIQFLRPSGAMAMVVPAEIVQTNYGVPTLRAICERFARVRLLVFAQNFFAQAQTETYLLLAEGYGATCRAVAVYPLSSIRDLENLELAAENVRATQVDLPVTGNIAFAQAFLTPEERRAWESVAERPEVIRIEDCGLVTNGYVTGANEFFHRTESDAIKAGIPAQWLRPTVRNATSLRGLVFSHEDLCALESRGSAHHLLDPPDGDLFNPHREQLRKLISEGEALEIHKRFKCRTRTPWWRVPGVYVPDLFLPYMIGRAPVTSTNAAGATYTNTLHGLRLSDGLDPHAVALALHSTLSLLSMELEGRSYGGGVLKLEPSEVNRVHLAIPRTFRQAARKADRLLRAGDYGAAVDVADEAVLGRTLQMDRETIALLRTARERLVARRYGRNRRGSA